MFRSYLTGTGAIAIVSRYKSPAIADVFAPQAPFAVAKYYSYEATNDLLMLLKRDFTYSTVGVDCYWMGDKLNFITTKNLNLSLRSSATVLAFDVELAQLEFVEWMGKSYFPSQKEFEFEPGEFYFKNKIALLFDTAFHGLTVVSPRKFPGTSWSQLMLDGNSN
jgi:hypothetical protein